MDAKFVDLVRQDQGVDAVDYLISSLPRQLTPEVIERCSEVMRDLSGVVRETYAYGIGLCCFERGLGDALSLWYTKNDEDCRAMVLNACWGEPPTQELGACAVGLAIDALGSKTDKVRSEACSVLQNQAASKADVSGCLSYLPSILQDGSDRVRQSAVCLIGNLAKSKAYALKDCCDGTLALVHDESVYVRHYAVWAIAHIAKRYDIEPVIPKLLAIVCSIEEEKDHRREAARAIANSAGSSVEKAAKRLAELDALTVESKQLDQLRAKLQKVIGKKR